MKVAEEEQRRHGLIWRKRYSTNNDCGHSYEMAKKDMCIGGVQIAITLFQSL